VLSSGTIAPVESGEIKATVATSGKRGRLTKTVRVRSNDPARPIVTLVVTMNVMVSENAGTGKNSSRN